MAKPVAPLEKDTLLSREDRAYLKDIQVSYAKRLKRVTRTPELAAKELQEAGILGADGKLRKQYRRVA